MADKNIVTLQSLMTEAKEKNKKIAKLRLEVVQEKVREEENEAGLWINTPFKEKGLTNDKMRQAFVKQQMILLYPSFYASKKAKLANLEADLKWIYEMVNIMKMLGVTEIELEEKQKEQEKTKNSE